MSDTHPRSVLHINQGICAIHASPSDTAECTSEALYGEQVLVLSQHDAWSRVRLLRDDYEGYLLASGLDPQPRPEQDLHHVVQRSTLLFSEPNMKSAVRHRIPFAAVLSLQACNDSPFSRTACGHFVWSAHCRPLAETLPESALALARRHFLGCPYRWGGRSPEGTDCSGLMQTIAAAKGQAIPRDSADQERFLDLDVPPAARQSEDLVYWPGHCGILVSRTEILHATAHSLSCVIEPLQQVVERAGAISSIKRLFAHQA